MRFIYSKGNIINKNYNYCTDFIIINMLFYYLLLYILLQSSEGVLQM